MLGAIIGDISGSRFEWENLKSKEFALLTYRCHPTDDSNMTLAVAQAILQSRGDWSQLSERAIASMRELGRKYPRGYGGRFKQWLLSGDPQPYGSWGNGSAMRVSPCAWAAASMEEALRLSDAVTNVTHNHPEGIKGARAITAAIFMARQGASMLEIRDYIHKEYYPMDFTLDQVRPTYEFDVSCQGSVPQAIEAFLESTSFEDAIRNAISIGGDSDTIAAMAGSIAEAYYGIPAEIRNHVLTFLDETQLDILNTFERTYGIALEKKINNDMTRPVSYTPKKAAVAPVQEEARQLSMLDALDTTEQAVSSTEPESRETTASFSTICIRLAMCYMGISATRILKSTSFRCCFCSAFQTAMMKKQRQQSLNMEKTLSFLRNPKSTLLSFLRDVTGMTCVRQRRM